MSESFDSNRWYFLRGMTAIDSKNQVVILGWKDSSDPLSLNTFQNNLDGELVEAQMKAPCQHQNSYYLHCLITVVQLRKELLTVSCNLCNDIKLVDMETKQVTPVFKSPTDSPVTFCSGPDDGLFIALDSGHIQQLDNSFMVTNTFHFTPVKDLVVSMCHLPPLHNTLVFIKGKELRAILLSDGQQIWSQKCKGFIPCGLPCPQQDVLLVSVTNKPQVHVVNPCDGVILQTIEIPKYLPH